MKDSELAALVGALAPVLREFVAAAVAPLSTRLDALETRAVFDPAAVDELRTDIQTIDGRVDGVIDAASKKLDELVESAVSMKVAMLPPPKDGRDGVDGKDGAPGAPGADGKDGQNGRDGKDADPEAVKAMVAEAMAALPPPKDGKDGRDGVDGKNGQDGASGQDGAPGEKGAPGERGEKGEPGRAGEDGRDGLEGKQGPPGKDGASLVDIIKDHEGSIVFTLSDGGTRKFIPVDGRDGRDGRDADPEFLRAAVRDEVKRQVSAPLADAYKGVWREGAYKKGDAVTSAGSLFIAMDDTETRPGTDESWKLAVKKGRDGKDGEIPRPPATVKLK